MLFSPDAGRSCFRKDLVVEGDQWETMGRGQTQGPQEGRTLSCACVLGLPPLRYENDYSNDEQLGNSQPGRGHRNSHMHSGPLVHQGFGSNLIESIRIYPVFSLLDVYVLTYSCECRDHCTQLWRSKIMTIVTTGPQSATGANRETVTCTCT